MISISQASLQDISSIQEIVKKTWPVAYGDIISKEQIDYMLNLFYSYEALKENIVNESHLFLLAKESDNCVGFAAIEHHYLNEDITRLHKLYLLPNYQGKGIGKTLLNEIEKLARQKNATDISLNVNKYNKALYFYQKNGFEITNDEIINIGKNFVMDDFKMKKKL